ncbi:MAG: TonB-dependent receptor [Acidobacteria bacterium]|nr:TonB-dependent receptor [Acidobacteriota bacterium]
MRMTKAFAVFSALSLFGLGAFAQLTSTIAGVVTTDTGEPLPGVVVNIDSNALQGSRSDVTREDGTFLFRLIPPGTYTVTATMPGMDTAKQDINLGLGQTARPRFKLHPVAEEVITVVGTGESILDQTEVASNMEFDKLEELPAGRTIRSAVLLAPGVTDGGPSGNISISGSQSFENLFLVNGVVVNENVRGQPHNVIVEDAIQEVSVLTGAISAEYGHFTGGVVNTLSKSGGNDFSGSIRVNFTNDDWQAKPKGASADFERTDKVNDIETVTLGGPILKDRLWFFFAGRRQRDEGSIDILAGTPMPDRIARRLGYPEGQWAPPAHTWPAGLDDDRFEIKFTGTIYEGHTLVASYQSRDTSEFNDDQFGVLNESALVAERQLPNTLLSFNYRGILTPELTLDLIYAEKEFTFENSGGTNQDPVFGSTIEGVGGNIGAPFFSSDPPEERDNRTMSGKLSYFLTTESLGSHDVVFGFSDFQESLKSDNHQAASDWRLFASYARWDTPADLNNPFASDPFPDAIPIFTADFNSILTFWPIIQSSQGSDFTQQSLYLNDNWRLNDKWRFNLGVRYDKNDVKAQDGTPLSDDDALSPRLSVSYDLFGNGKHVFSASYGEYIAKIANAADDISSAGVPARMGWYYFGDTTESVADVFEWFSGLYDIDMTQGRDAIQQQILANQDALNDAYFLVFPGVTTIIEKSLKSPNVEEFTVSYGTPISDKGFFKASYVNRSYDNFYIDRINQSTGQVEVTPGVFEDRAVLGNSNGEYTRDYDSVQLQADYRFTDRFSIGGNYTWSQLVGNIVGETSGSGSISVSTTTAYPEFNDYPNRNPNGYLPGDQRHRANIWVQYDQPTPIGDFNVSLLQRFNSGEPYGYVAGFQVGRDYEDWGLPNPADFDYVSPPDSIVYWLTGRGEFRADDFYRTDLALNYKLRIRKLEFFLELECYNILNTAAYLGADPNITIDTTGAPAFNLYTETPVEGTHYHLDENDLDPNFYQAPRWFQFDVGFKF